jgi:HEAT repeat protein
MALVVATLLQAETLAEDLKRANDADRPQHQHQATERIRKRGVEAVEPVLAWVKQHGRNAMSIGFTQFLGELRHEKVTALLVEAVRDRDFYWRPAATAALGEHAVAAHRDLLRSLMSDGLWGVRAAAIKGLERLNDRESLPAIRERLNDEIYDVRAQAAKTMHAFGDETGLPVLVEALRSAVTWFDIDYGQLAREDAWKFLKELTKDDFGFKPWEPISQRQAGLAKWEAWIAAKYPKWRDMLPANARTTADTAEYVLGFELRSCQKGEFFFRIDSENNLVLGFFNLVRARLTKEERASIDAALVDARKVDPNVPYGRGGCDFEQYYFKSEGGRFDKLWIGLGGRPTEIDRFIRVMRDLIKAKFGEAESAMFKELTDLFRGMD